MSFLLSPNFRCCFRCRALTGSCAQVIRLICCWDCCCTFWISVSCRCRKLIALFWVIWVFRVCLFPDHRVFKKQLSGRTDYGFHSYGELCDFVYCLLTQTRRVADLPVLSDWDAYMDSSRVAALGKIDVDDFLANHPFGDALRRAYTGEVRDVRSRCP